MSQPDVIRNTIAEDGAALRAIRLEALRDCPVAFTADLAESENFRLDYWRDLASRGSGNGCEAVFLAQLDGQVVGMLGIFADVRRPKLRHSATIWGVYVRFAHRGNGVAAQLLDAAIQWARAKPLVMVKLSVVEGNTIARRCYERSGFAAYGVEPKAIFLDGRYFDEVLMAIHL